MMKYQLWMRDEYGTGAIIGTFDTTNDALKRGRTIVTDANFSNSLSSSEQMKSVEAYMVEFAGKNSLSVYSGLRQGKHSLFKDGSVGQISDLDLVPVNIYIGSKFAKNKNGAFDETPFYMKDEKGNVVTKLNHSSLNGKTVYFVCPINV